MERIRSITTITSRTRTSPARRNPSGSIRNAQTTSASHTRRARPMCRGCNDSVGASPWRAFGAEQPDRRQRQAESDQASWSAGREGNPGPARCSGRGTPTRFGSGTAATRRARRSPARGSRGLGASGGRRACRRRLLVSRRQRRRRRLELSTRRLVRRPDRGAERCLAPCRPLIGNVFKMETSSAMRKPRRVAPMCQASLSQRHAEMSRGKTPTGHGR